MEATVGISESPSIISSDNNSEKENVEYSHVKSEENVRNLSAVDFPLYSSTPSLLLPSPPVNFLLSCLYSIPAPLLRVVTREPRERGAAGAAPCAHLSRRALSGQQGAAGPRSSPGPAPGPVDPAAAGAREGASSLATAGLKGGGRSVPAARSASGPPSPAPAPPPIPERGAAPRRLLPRPQLLPGRSCAATAGVKVAPAEGELAAEPPGSRRGRSRGKRQGNSRPAREDGARRAGRELRAGGRRGVGTCRPAGHERGPHARRGARARAGPRGHVGQRALRPGEYGPRAAVPPAQVRAARSRPPRPSGSALSRSLKRRGGWGATGAAE